MPFWMGSLELRKDKKLFGTVLSVESSKEYPHFISCPQGGYSGILVTGTCEDLFWVWNSWLRTFFGFEIFRWTFFALKILARTFLGVDENRKALFCDMKRDKMFPFLVFLNKHILRSTLKNDCSLPKVLWQIHEEWIKSDTWNISHSLGVLYFYCFWCLKNLDSF